MVVIGFLRFILLFNYTPILLVGIRAGLFGRRYSITPPLFSIPDQLNQFVEIFLIVEQVLGYVKVV